MSDVRRIAESLRLQADRARPVVADDGATMRYPWPLGTARPVGALYESRGVVVISTRVDAVYPSGVGHGLQDHVSVSRRKHRAPQSDIDRALEDIQALCR